MNFSAERAMQGSAETGRGTGREDRGPRQGHRRVDARPRCKVPLDVNVCVQRMMGGIITEEFLAEEDDEEEAQQAFSH